MPRRLISNNILAVYEILNFLKHKRLGKLGLLVFKLDMSKAYDKIEWSFLRLMLKQMSFSNSWVQMLMRCVESVSYSVVINGEAGE